MIDFMVTERISINFNSIKNYKIVANII